MNVSAVVIVASVETYQPTRNGAAEALPELMMLEDTLIEPPVRPVLGAVTEVTTRSGEPLPNASMKPMFTERAWFMLT